MKLSLSWALMFLLVSETISQDFLEPRVNILTELMSMKEKIKVMEEEIKDLRTVNRVAFSAFLLDSKEATNVGPFSTLTGLVYKHVFLNVGDAYSPVTGVFTAPLKGAYVFRVFSKLVGFPGRHLTVGLFKNDVHVFSTYAHQDSGFYSSSNGVSLTLEKGDTVNTRLYPQSSIFDNGEHHHSSFSGHLLFPL